MKIEVAIPCFNEEATVAKVIGDFKKALAGADVTVYDNNSTDRTAELARQAGARVVSVSSRGKGNVVKEIFESTEADVVVMADGDDTYEAEDAKLLIEPVLKGEADMVIGTRLHSENSQFRKLHLFGNRILTVTLNMLFGTDYKDILSGYRAFSRRFMKDVPLIGTGFEIESEFMIQALENGMAVREVPIRFRKRPGNSKSKLSTFGDGYRIMLTIVSMLRDHRPLFLFSLLALANVVLGCSIWAVGFVNITKSYWFYMLKRAGIYLVAASFALFLVGLILNTVNVRMREITSLLKRRK